MLKRSNIIAKKLNETYMRSSCFISIILRNTSQRKLSRLYNYDYDSISSFIFMAKSDIEIGLEAKHFTFSLWNSLLNSS